MSEQQAPLFERRLDSHRKLKALLQARTDALVSFSRLAAMRPFRPHPAVRRMLHEFCRSLADYVEAAHGLLYRFHERGAEKRQDVREVADCVYPRIADTTRRILRFTEIYDSGERSDNLSQLAEDLSGLGELLADRILMEDKLLDVHMRGR